MKKVLLVLVLICLAMAPAFATTIITGNIGFNGSVVLLNATSVNTATQVSAWGDTTVGKDPGLLGTLMNDPVTFSSAWFFNGSNTPITDFWKVDGYHFRLTSSSIFSQGGGFLNVTGTGILTKDGSTDTAIYSWSFSAQDPSSSNPTSTFTFSASAAPAPTPEPASLALLSAGLIGLGGLVRRRK